MNLKTTAIHKPAPHFPVLVKQTPGINNLGNKLLQFALFEHIKHMMDIPMVLYGVTIPELQKDFCSEPHPPKLDNPLILDKFACNRIDADLLQSLVSSGIYDGIWMKGWGTNLRTLGPQKRYLEHLINRLPSPIRTVFPKDTLLINLRLGEIVSDPCKHSDYTPLPVKSYRPIIEQSKLKPIFYGQITPGPYLDELKSEYPDAGFIEGAGLDAFWTIRNAKHKVLSVSTFSWLAAWLGPPDTRIFMPIAGAFHPLQRPDWNLIPWNDPRYRFIVYAPYPRTREHPLSTYLEEWHTMSQPYPIIHPKESRSGQSQLE